MADEYEYKDLDDETVLELFRRHSDPVLTAPEVADAFDITSQGANKRLRNLHEDGCIQRKKVGGAAVVYWLCG